MNDVSQFPSIDQHKQPELYELGYFALDVGVQLYDQAFGEKSQRMHRLASEVLQRARYSNAPEHLAEAISSLEPKDRQFVVRWINFGPFTGSASSRSLHLLETAFDREWLRSVGFAGRPAFEEEFGQELYSAFDEIADAHNALFCTLDDDCQTLLTRPVDAKDQRILTEVLTPSNVEESLSYLMYYVLAEDIRTRLTSLSIAAETMDMLSARMSARLSTSGRDAPSVSWSEALK